MTQEHKVEEVNPIENNVDKIKSYSEDEISKLYIKVNLPSNISSYNSGNGEGCWAIPNTDEDAVILNEDKDKTTAKIILCNDSVYFPPLVYGSVLQVEIRCGQRAVLDVNWMHEQLLKIDLDFINILKEEN
jgi:hypothetical protein